MLEKCHFIGIGGIGMSALARIALSKNMHVQGSDISANYVTSGLSEAGAKVYIGHSAQYISPDLKVIFTTDIKQDNPEYIEAKRLNCKMFHRSEFLAQLMEDKKSLTVAGTHGKTTTSSLLAAVLKEAGMSPSYVVGGILHQYQSNADIGKGEYFVAEADESDGTFLNYHSFGSIITNIDLDHMNYYQTEERLLHAFDQFGKKVISPSHLFWCGDDERLMKLALPGFRYGFSENSHLRASNVRQSEFSMLFDIIFEGKNYNDVAVSLVGMHNVLNALAVFGLALKLGAKEESIRTSFTQFKGVKRRCEKKGEEHNILVLDDYAHHPTEIKTTLEGIRKAVKERRLIAVFQPHRYSRTKDCLGNYGAIFDVADEVIVTDIFASGEEPIPGVTTSKVFEEVKSSTKALPRYIPREQLLNELATHVRPHDVLVTLGAGDVTKFADEFVKVIKTGVKKWKIALFFGGKSLEHEVSLLSAKHVAASLDPDLYEIVYFGITKEGKWIVGDKAKKQLETLTALEADEMFPLNLFEQLLACDILFPMLHGTNCEDGTLQGFFEILNKPYVGCNYRSAACAMDKGITKILVKEANIPTLPFVSISEAEWRERSGDFLNEIDEKLQLPLFVKPSHLGSSVGIKKVEKRENLERAILDAFEYDTHLIIESGVIAREIEFAVFGNDEVTVFPPGEVCTNGKFYDYDLKYGKEASKVLDHAPLPLELEKQGMELAKRAYQAVGCTGFARVDFFLDGNHQFWLNEINPIPGFTKNSLYPRMAAFNGYAGASLMDKLVILGLHDKRYKDKK